MALGDVGPGDAGYWECGTWGCGSKGIWDLGDVTLRYVSPRECET